MAVLLYMDHNVPRAITNALRQRNVDVITAFEDNAHDFPDVELLDRAAALGRVLFTRDTDFLAEAGRRQENGIFQRYHFCSTAKSLHW